MGLLASNKQEKMVLKNLNNLDLSKWSHDHKASIVMVPLNLVPGFFSISASWAFLAPNSTARNPFLLFSHHKYKCTTLRDLIKDTLLLMESREGRKKGRIWTHHLLVTTFLLYLCAKTRRPVDAPFMVVVSKVDGFLYELFWAENGK